VLNQHNILIYTTTDDTIPIAEENMSKVYFIYKTEFGRVFIESDGNAITQIKTEAKINPKGKKEADVLTDKAALQLVEYFSGKRNRFDIPLNPHGTDFQCSVWKALCDIPFGETRSYKQIACAVNNPNACRAVGLANNRNPIWIMIPCHRVIGTDGGLTGYGGGLEMKQRLLELENKRNGRS